MNDAIIELHNEATPATAVSPLALRLAKIGRGFYKRGWNLGTSGNFSAVVNRDPLQLLITASGLDKGALSAESFLHLDESGNVIAGHGRPSAESSLHLAIVKRRKAQAVLHTHTVWSAILSEAYGDSGGFFIEGFEMLKGLEGVNTHQHHEWLPIIENSQDYDALSQQVEMMLQQQPNIHGFLLRRHGLYTWGVDVEAAKRHVEIFEFLFEVLGRTHH
ncbi:MAG: methylthioribulose 1-phosphate dehydratase [Acidobacteria bacterium]|nr:methylthioribulose 1-phosphate dehydratase [Acidobacteriota bacterium]